MSHTSMMLSALMMMAMVVFVAPNIFARNRGHILRNIALWLAIFLGLGLIYQNFGPDSPHPLFEVPRAMSGMRVMRNNEPAENKQPIDTPKGVTGDTDDDSKNNGEQGFTPPKE